MWDEATHSQTLSNLNQASVPHQYKFLAQKSMSWEKFFHFQVRCLNLIF